MGETYPGALCSNEKQRIRYNYSNTERLSKNVIPSIKKIRDIRLSTIYITLKKCTQKRIFEEHIF